MRMNFEVPYLFVAAYKEFKNPIKYIFDGLNLIKNEYKPDIYS